MLPRAEIGFWFLYLADFTDACGFHAGLYPAGNQHDSMWWLPEHHLELKMSGAFYLLGQRVPVNPYNPTFCYRIAT
jgi:hypothetical protein